MSVSLQSSYFVNPFVRVPSAWHLYLVNKYSNPFIVWQEHPSQQVPISLYFSCRRRDGEECEYFRHVSLQIVVAGRSTKEMAKTLYGEREHVLHIILPVIIFLRLPATSAAAEPYHKTCVDNSLKSVPHFYGICPA